MVASAKKKKIRVGFDFDGVIFYNSARNLRAYIYFVKRYLLGIKKTKFYLPKNPLVQKIAFQLHKSSHRPNTGFEDFLKLIKNPKYEVYIITARMSFMKDDIHDLLQDYDLSGIKQIIQNHQDQQPHLYKLKLIKQLKLDYFVEDNWDIVKYLSTHSKTKIIWIDNLVDSLFIKYTPKARNLKKALKYLL